MLARSKREGFEVRWWREGSKEVDFVLKQRDKLLAIEVKSGAVKKLTGLDAFKQAFSEARTLIVGSPIATLEDFLLGNVPLFS